MAGSGCFEVVPLFAALQASIEGPFAVYRLQGTGISSLLGLKPQRLLHFLFSLSHSLLIKPSPFSTPGTRPVSPGPTVRLLVPSLNL
eukprot:1145307-Pelagomonas_calceolata.AAC.6